jgi:hypothetical protein
MHKNHQINDAEFQEYCIKINKRAELHRYATEKFMATWEDMKWKSPLLNLNLVISFLKRPTDVTIEEMKQAHHFIQDLADLFHILEMQEPMFGGTPLLEGFDDL